MHTVETGEFSLPNRSGFPSGFLSLVIDLSIYEFVLEMGYTFRGFCYAPEKNHKLIVPSKSIHISREQLP